jgi:spore germination cell wall hydrolase CwlJ-like protein
MTSQPAVGTAEPTGESVAGTAEEDCLATAVYFEAKGEPRRGQVAVAQVVVNRTRSGRFPSSVCGVVRQRGQFSFVRHGHLPAVSRSSAAWREADSVARKVLDGSAERVAERALFFHARGVAAGWHAVRVAQIGNQIFYR